jgi:predicted DsbA family dithiol-disulfide isomerase
MEIFEPPRDKYNNEIDGWKCWEQDETYISRGLWPLRGGIAARMIGHKYHNEYMAKILEEKHVKHKDVRSRETIIDLAQKLSFPNKFTDFIDDETRLKEISEDYIYAESLGVFGTPTFLFDDTHLAF